MGKYATRVSTLTVMKKCIFRLLAEFLHFMQGISWLFGWRTLDLLERAELDFPFADFGANNGEEKTLIYATFPSDTCMSSVVERGKSKISERKKSFLHRDFIVKSLQIAFLHFIIIAEQSRLILLPLSLARLCNIHNSNSRVHFEFSIRCSPPLSIFSTGRSLSAAF